MLINRQFQGVNAILTFKSKAMSTQPGGNGDKQKRDDEKEEKEEKKHRDERIDEGIDESFPASDPPSTSQPGSDR